MADTLQQTKRQLSIKTGVVKRSAKEVEIYKKEAADQAKVVEKYSMEGSDEWEAKNASKVLKDCEQMIAPAQQRLEDAIEALKDLVDATSSDAEISSLPEFTAAKEMLASVPRKDAEITA